VRVIGHGNGSRGWFVTVGSRQVIGGCIVVGGWVLGVTFTFIVVLVLTFAFIALFSFALVVVFALVIVFIFVLAVVFVTFVFIIIYAFVTVLILQFTRSAMPARVSGGKLAREGGDWLAGGVCDVPGLVWRCDTDAAVCKDTLSPV
jgi:O-antigen ligase